MKKRMITPFRAICLAPCLMSSLGHAGGMSESFARQTRCVQEAMYAEAGGEGPIGQWLVWNVIANRAVQQQKDVCKIIYAKGQFTYNHAYVKRLSSQGKIPKDIQERAAKATFLFFMGFVLDFSNGSTAYHAKEIKPYWSRVYTKTLTYRNHIFYKEK